MIKAFQGFLQLGLNQFVPVIFEGFTNRRKVSIMLETSPYKINRFSS
ncbi:hypothetical protein ADIS_1794 [Lunatimonas lonarensis]|uniref:Uncharacterized protein n=1 Tax=Lunatimonas lonarensis TaxID=1232681 RepID=R7ZUP6_9BACT|nr:hypothetical protein ADIS_1794 [Lunatimonas lonarensis]